MEKVIEYHLIRKRRKTLAIHITKEGVVEVRAPLKLPKTEIDKFVYSKLKWIEKHVALRALQKEKRDAFFLDYGKTILLRGKEIKIEEREGREIGFDGNVVFMPPDLHHEEIKEHIIRLYKYGAKSILTEKVASFSKVMSVTPKEIKINKAKTRWGSCTSEGNLNFSWRLILAPDPVIDYVVVHELAHLKEMNHSEKFWAIVEKELPDYRAREAGLKTLQKRLNQEDWD